MAFKGNPLDLNPHHPDFSKIKLVKKEVYRFDPRPGTENTE